MCLQVLLCKTLAFVAVPSVALSFATLELLR